MSNVSRWRRWLWFTVAGIACGAVFGLIQMQAGVREMIPLVLPPFFGGVVGFGIDIVRAGIATRDASRREMK